MFVYKGSAHIHFEGARLSNALRSTPPLAKHSAIWGTLNMAMKPNDATNFYMELPNNFTVETNRENQTRENLKTCAVMINE